MNPTNDSSINQQQPSNDPCPKEKQQEYLERYRFWSNQSIKQLSFSNNLLLTISVAAFGYFFGKREKVYGKLFFDLHASIDWAATLFITGSVLLALSIICGAVLSINRLYDFRLTRHISIIRKRVCKAGSLLKDDKMQTPKVTTAFHDLWLLFWRYETFAISEDECCEINDSLKKKFEDLRKLSKSLGRTTWFLFNSQFVSFVLVIFIYVIVIVIM
jgi:hypothetical protein